MMQDADVGVSDRDAETLGMTVTTALRRVLAVLDDAGAYPDAAIHIQWAIDLLGQDGGDVPPPADPR